jgi:hypothetical protein
LAVLEKKFAVVGAVETMSKNLADTGPVEAGPIDEGGRLRHEEIPLLPFEGVHER